MRHVWGLLWGALIGILGGLIGLGGAEFRLPVLVGVFRFPTLQAIVINLIVSLVTVVFSFIFRTGFVNLDSIIAHGSVILNILAGSLIGHDFLFHEQSLVFPALVSVPLGFVAGVVIGVFSSMLGVAGGELQPPLGDTPFTLAPLGFLTVLAVMLCGISLFHHVQPQSRFRTSLQKSLGC